MRKLLAICLLIPVLMAAPVYARVPVVKGLAILKWSAPEDLAALAVGHYYAWDEYCSRPDAPPGDCTNMVRGWQLPQACYPTLLVGNEPTNPEPAGYPISARAAAQATVAIAALCPNTQLIVANIHINNAGTGDKAWLSAYYAEYKAITGRGYGTLAHSSGLKDLVGLHCYALLFNTCKTRLSNIFSMTAYRGQFWLTEWHVYGDQYGAGAGEFSKMLAWIAAAPRIERAYIYTNRQSGTLLDLVNPDGTLTTQGAQYRDWIP